MWIIFDVGNVIIQADHAITHKILQGYGVPKGRAEKFYKAPEYKEFCRGEITGKDFYSALVKKYLKFGLTYGQVVYAHNQHIYAADKNAIEIIKKLSKFDIAFLTDTNKWQTQRERELVDISVFSKTIFRSHETHMLKTDPGLFPYIIKKLKAKPADMLLIDDSPEKVKKAEQNGLRTICFESPNQLEKELKKQKLLD